MERYGSFDFEPNPRLCKSASESLDQYIRQYNADQQMARSMTCKKTQKRDTRLMDSLRSDLSALDEEILLAKQLFSDEEFNQSYDNTSLTTEELLMDHPLHTSSILSSPEWRERSGYLRVTDLQEEEFRYEERLSSLRHRTPSPTSHANSTNSRFVQARSSQDSSFTNAYGQHYSRGTQPTRYTRSKISSDDIRGEITVSVNCDPRQQTLYSVGHCHPQKEHLSEDRLNYSQPNGADLEKEGNISVSLQLEGKPASVREFMGECFAESPSTEKVPSSHPEERTVESLKNMLYSLQEISNNAKSELGVDGTGDGNDVYASGCESLEKAMKHLVILKNLVKEVGSPDKRGK